MKYHNFKKDDFIKDEYFQKWILSPDAMSKKFWNNWIDLHPEKKEEVDEAIREVRILASDDQNPLSQTDFDAMWQNIVERREKTEKDFSRNNSPVKNTWKRAMKVAAIFVGLLAISYGSYQSGLFRTDAVPVEPSMQVTLELQDGTIKTIDETETGLITASNGQKITQQKKSVLVYNDQENNATETLVYNELRVPYGKKFEVVLSDGSRVMLNSGTKLRYPVKFIKGKPRDVFLDGEAFFIVAEDKDRPFTVITDEMNTRVYGTKFNVTSYKDEHNTSTVLVEGSVHVYLANNDKGKRSIAIVPGEKAVFKEGKIKVKKVDVKKYIAWTKGKLYFVNDRFELILKELERHFDIQINNQADTLNLKRFTGDFKNEPVEGILNIFKEHTPFQYERKGDTITIKPYRPM